MYKKLSAEQKSVIEFLGDKNAFFLIPDYQRPYDWSGEECQTLWEDIFAFVFPDEDNKKFDPYNDEYFLGSTVFYRNKNGQKEVIDGQQRITTLMLLFRAFYVRYEKFKDDKSATVCREIGKCIWNTDEYDNPDKNSFKIDSEVATDDEKKELFHILRTGETKTEEAKEYHSRYGEIYKFFLDKIDEFLAGEYHGFFTDLPNRLLKNCIFLQMETESFESALRIFSTLNDRGKPLSDSDIFKSKLYRYYKSKGHKDDFIKKWKKFEERCQAVYYRSKKITPVDEAFTRYMYYERACRGIKTSTIEALRSFYEKNNYELLKKPETFRNIYSLINFWDYVDRQSRARFSDRVLKRLFVLHYAPNEIWVDFVSVYYLAKRDEKGRLDDEEFYNFLNKTIAYIWGSTLLNPAGLSALKAPIYNEMVNIVKGEKVDFKDRLFSSKTLSDAFEKYKFSNNRTFTKSMLAWWALQNDKQPRLGLGTAFDIEHIYPKNRYLKEVSLSNSNNLESIGNKSLLEKDINIKASDYRFHDKAKYYTGFTKANGEHEKGTEIRELLKLAKNKKDFTEQDIIQRHAEIKSSFIEFVKENDLIK